MANKPPDNDPGNDPDNNSNDPDHNLAREPATSSTPTATPSDGGKDVHKRADASPELPRKADDIELPSPGESPADELNRVQMGKTSRLHTATLLGVCALIFGLQMGSYGMFDPWETHYTEVARQFMVRGDWLSTYWHNGTGPEGFAETNFWSKPVGSFWMSGLSLKLFGYGAHTTGETIATTQIEWAVRLPFVLCALFGIFCVYLACTRLFGRRAGLIAGGALATAPMYFMIGRQAMTDMPYVGLISGGIALFMLGIFGERETMPTKSVKLGRWRISWPHCGTYYLFLAAFILFMGLQLNAIIGPLRRVPMPFKLLGHQMSAALVMGIYGALALVFIWLSRKTKTRNEVYIYGFFMATGIAGLAKGLIGALQPGFVILIYLIVSREWWVLTHVALGRGLLIAVCVFFPWYHGMLLRYGKPFWNELFGTEQLRRLTIGEQAQAKGTFEYYVSQLAYGFFPWVAFLPAGLARAFGGGMKKERTARDRARLFAAAWLVATCALFTLTLTKYHHYILPAIPPAAILIALFLDDLVAGKVRAPRLSLAVGAAVLLIVGFDLIKQPAHWVWMFTYLYTSNWARGVPSYETILYFSLLFAIPLLLLFIPRMRKVALWATLAVGVAGGGYVINGYLLACAPHWSQKRVIQTYYRARRSPKEKLVAWQFNWRGETWYTGAEVVVSKSLDNKKIIAWLNERKGTRFFFITERSRYGSLRGMLPTSKAKQTLRIVDDSNIHYVLAAAEI